MVKFPKQVYNWVEGKEYASRGAQWIEKFNPATGIKLCELARSEDSDVEWAVSIAKREQKAWGRTPGVTRGEILHKIVMGMIEAQDILAEIVHLETGKSRAHAKGEVKAAIQLGLFYASEGQRLYGRTTTSGVANKTAMTIRQPIGVAGLIIAANTPIANVAWKVFPALICGNSVVLKAAEDTPLTAWYFGKLAVAAGIPNGVLNIIQGLGVEAGEALVKNSDVDVISFTGSTAVGKRIQSVAGPRLARISLELGGKNPLLVCEDADLDRAVEWAVQSAFSNAGQRCASGSRLLVVDSVYENFKKKLVARTESLKVGSSDSDDFGPVINLRQLERQLKAIEGAKARGIKLLTGGSRLGGALAKGYYLAPTIFEGGGADDPLSQEELFGPITVINRVKDFNEGLQLANQSLYGLTAAIHTQNFDRAMRFCEEVESGVAVVNGGTFGSEPHMPFGGRKLSGNGTREPGTEALDIYSELKDIYLNIKAGDL